MNVLPRNQRKLAKQRENIQELLQLCQAHPDLPIIPMVDTDIVCDDTHNWWLGGFGGCCLDEIITLPDGASICKSDADYAWLYELFFDDDDDFDASATEIKIKEKVDSLNWLPCITITIGLPEFDIPGRRGY